MSKVFFSIVIPVYNRAERIEATVQSVLSQHYTHFELILVDDGSTDNTGQVLKKLISHRPDVNVKYYYKENGERGAARNFGAAKAKGDFINFVDSDDLLYPNHLEEANRLINQNPNSQWFHLNYDKKSTNGKLTGTGPNLGKNPKRNLISGNSLSCNGVFVKRELAIKNPFCEKRVLAGVEDWELWLRLASQFPLLLSEKITSSIIFHDERSVLEKNHEKLIQRFELFMRLIQKNTPVTEFMGKDRSLFYCSCYSYISLHLALMKGRRRLTLLYLLKSLRSYPAFVFHKRFFAILKHLF
jgi:glycosyltransferase involved in cell wall biosynthesis